MPRFDRNLFRDIIKFQICVTIPIFNYNNMFEEIVEYAIKLVKQSKRTL